MSELNPSEFEHRPQILRWAGFSIVGMPILLLAMILLMPTPEATSAEISPRPSGKSSASLAVVDARASNEKSTLVEPVGAEPTVGEADLSARVGRAWMKTTDDRMGGTSVVDLQLADGGLSISGELLQGAMFPWAGAITFLGSDPMEAVDYSARKELTFRARGDGRTYSVMLFSGDMQGIPPTLTFGSSSEWTHITLPLDGFRGADLTKLRAVSFAATGPLGEFRFEIDDVDIR